MVCNLVLGAGVFEMERSIQFSEQRLLQASVDLCNQLAEVQKLRAAIQSAEASKQCLTDPKVINSVGRPDFTAFDC